MRYCGIRLKFKFESIRKKTHVSICEKCNILYHKKPLLKCTYKYSKKDFSNFSCTECVSDIKTTKRTHPIHDKPVPSWKVGDPTMKKRTISLSVEKN